MVFYHMVLEREFQGPRVSIHGLKGKIISLKLCLKKKVKEGDLRRLKCTALSGNPLPQLQWFAGGQVIEEGVTR